MIQRNAPRSGGTRADPHLAALTRRCWFSCKRRCNRWLCKCLFDFWRICLSKDFNDLLLPPPGHRGPLSTHRIINITLQRLHQPFHVFFHLFPMLLTLTFFGAEEKQQISNRNSRGYLSAQTGINWVRNLTSCVYGSSTEITAGEARVAVAGLNPQESRRMVRRLPAKALLSNQFYQMCVPRMLSTAVVKKGLFLADEDSHPNVPSLLSRHSRWPLK